MNLCAEANETVNAVTVDIAGVLGAANGYGIFVEGITEQSGDSEANEVNFYLNSFDSKRKKKIFFF